MKIGIFLPNWIGDTAMSTPTLRALRTRFGPRAEMVGVLRPYVSEVLAGADLLHDQIFFHPRATVPSQRPLAVARELRRRKLDMVVLLTNSFRSAAMARFSGAPVRAGFVRNGRGLLLTHKLYFPRLGLRRLPVSAMDNYLQIAYVLGCEPQLPRVELATLPYDEAAADAVWSKCHLPHGRQVVVLNSGGAYGSTKLWPSEHFASLARRIVDELKLAVLVTCGPAEREIARRIVRQADHPRVVSLADESVSIGLTKACVRRSRLLVTTDSGPRFFAVAFGVPLVTLFGPTHQGWSQTHDPNEICLQRDMPCGPCGRRTCPLGHHDCMRSLGVDTVYRAVVAQLARQSGGMHAA